MPTPRLHEMNHIFSFPSATAIEDSMKEEPEK